MKLNFKMSELLKSDAAKRYGIDNTPSAVAMDCMLELIFYCLQPLRDKSGKAMIVTSGYRCQKLNTKIGGVATSQHCKGQAADFTFEGWSVKEGIDFIKKSGVEYDQLINEYDRWIHVSFVKGKNRKQYLKIT